MMIGIIKEFDKIGTFLTCFKNACNHQAFIV